MSVEWRENGGQSVELMITTMREDFYTPFTLLDFTSTSYTCLGGAIEIFDVTF